MRPVLLEEAASEAVVARAIHNADGSVLLRAGVRLSYRYRTRLKELGITQIYVRDPLAEGIEVEDVVSEATRARLTRELAAILFRLLAGGETKEMARFPIDHLRDLVREAIAEMRERRSAIYSHIGIRPVDDYTNYTAFHCASCVLLALTAGMKMGWAPHKLEEIGLAEALHDLGKARINQRMLYKAGRLTEEEFDEIKRHPALGHEILQRRDDLSPRVVQVALHHHEKMNGKGYPLGLTGEKLSEFDRLSAIVDVFDALASERIYKPRKSFDETLSILEEETAAGLFDADLLARLKAVTPRHPVGSLVALSTGEFGIVARYEGGDVTRPVVRPLYLPDGSDVGRTVEYPLGGEASIAIVKECVPGARPRIR